MNEFQLYLTADPRPSRATAPSWWRRTTSPMTPSCRHLAMARFNDLKVIECHELLTRLAGKPARMIEFAEGSRSSVRMPRWHAPSRKSAGWM